MNPLLMLDVIRFELRRSMTVGRGAIWIFLVLFPIALISTLRVIAPMDRVEPWGIMLYFLVPEVVCLLGLLLWATPAISTEIEGQTWVYLATRRSGRTFVLLGKYMTAVLWSFTAALVAITVCAVVMGPAGGFRLWSVMCLLSLFSCLAHAAIYVVIGTIFFRRTIVTAVFYTLVIEYGLSFVPAVANKLTVNYRLRGLLADWMNWDEARSAAENVFGTEPASTHLMVLAAFTVALLAAAMFRVGHTEFPTQQEG